MHPRFRIECVRAIGEDECESVEYAQDIPHKDELKHWFFIPSYHLYPVFQAGGWWINVSGGHSIHCPHSQCVVDVRALVEQEGYKVSFAFWDQTQQRYKEIEQAICEAKEKAIRGGRWGLPRRLCHDPKSVLETLEAVASVLQKHANSLPRYFYFMVKQEQSKIDWSWEATVLWQGRVYELGSSWDCCIAIPSGSQEVVDLRGVKAIECVVLKWASHGGEEYKHVGPVTVEVISETFYEYANRLYLREMMEVCRTALRYDWLIFTST